MGFLLTESLRNIFSASERKHTDFGLFGAQFGALRTNI